MLRQKKKYNSNCNKFKTIPVIHPVNIDAPAGETKFHGLDHLRAFAIAFVFISHFPLPGLPNWLAAFVNLGWSGVDLFFVLSGFLIATQLFNTIGNKNWLGLFFVKRFFRIVPAYFAVVMLYFLFPFFREGLQLPPLWKFLTFTQNIAPDPVSGGAFFHAWSLCIEEQFYLFFPLVLLTVLYFKVMRKGIYIIAALFLFTCLLRFFLWQHYVVPLHTVNPPAADLFWLQWIYCPAYTRLDGLLTGIAIAGFYKYFPLQKERFLQYGNYILLAGIMVLAIAFAVSVKRISFNANILGLPLLAIGYGLIVMAAISPACILYRFKSKLTGFIAGISYSIYLIHRSIIYICSEKMAATTITGNAILFIVSIGATIAAAVVIRQLVEKPALNFRKSLVHKYYS